MLAKLIKRLFSGSGVRHDSNERTTSFQRASDLILKQDTRSAIAALREHLARFPLDAHALNDLGCCLKDIGDDNAAFALFEKAFSIDDSYLPVVINHAKGLVDKKRIYEAVGFLRQAKAYEPYSPNVNSVYASMAFNKSDASTARTYALKAWLGSFDTLRLANCYLFDCAYCDDIDEARLAAEHRFWAETLLPQPVSLDEVIEDGLALPAKGKKVRIGYWSPDFRNHSVRYFIFPLLENHDREKFEIVAYHDSPHHDEKTDAIKACCDHFIPVGELPDTRLVSLIRSHRLDILVELAGQTSANRLNLLRERLASRQLTGIGYPPTTGLASLDGKLLDSHIADDDSPRYYTEPPLVLDHSFWCFDPKEEPEIAEEPPAAKNGYITFACVGNIAKITQAILVCWAKILERVPNSRLLIRSISLTDQAAADAIAGRLLRANIDLARVDLHGPVGGTEFFTSYNSVDMVLDTFPFNGGTTTCFATYMGVPVVSMAGQSLLSRMGKSVLGNLGLTDWIASDYDEYVEKAVGHARNIAFLAHFRGAARSLYAASALGNGRMFARDFEKHCLALLAQAGPSPSHCVAALPAEELVERAYAVFRLGQFEAAGRIVDHCLNEHPNCGTAHILWTQRLTGQGMFSEAIEYLESRLGKFSPDERFLALVNIARFNMLCRQERQAEAAILRAGEHIPDKRSDVLQLRLLQAYLSSPMQPRINGDETSDTTVSSIKRLSILIVCDDNERFSFIENSLRHTCKMVDGLEVRYRQCGEENRWKSYVDCLRGDDDALIILQRHVDVCNEQLFADILGALEKFDILGIGGARYWDRIDWRHSPIADKASSLLIPSGEADGFYEINFSGTTLTPLVGDMAVLDGGFLAIRTAGFRSLDPRSLFDPLLERGGLFPEEYFTHAAFSAGLKLGVHQNLGVMVDWRVPLIVDHLGEARWQIAQRLSFDPLEDKPVDGTTFSIPIDSPEAGMRILGSFLAGQ